MKHARTCGDVSDATWRMFLLERQIRRAAQHAPTFRATVAL